MRKISPFISVVLITLVLSGSQGFTFIRHICNSCGTDELFAAHFEKESCCCIHDDENPAHVHSMGDLVFSDDCCTHETERLITAELIRTEVQPEVMPYFMAAAITAIIPKQSERPLKAFVREEIEHFGRDLATLHCQILS